MGDFKDVLTGKKGFLDSGPSSTVENRKKDKPDEFQAEKENEGMTIHTVRNIKIFLLLFTLFFDVFFGVFGIKGFILFLQPYIMKTLPFVVLLNIIMVLSLIFLKETRIDMWVPKVGSTRIGSSYAKLLTNKKFVINYQPTYQMKDIKEFVMEITNKSDQYNYFIHKINKNFNIIILKTAKKQDIPESVVLNYDILNVEKWNAVPLGVTIGNKGELVYYSWVLNKNEKMEETKNKIKPYKNNPSVSILISGSTGSGKSVCENNIIRHINRFPNKIQGLLCDQKRVEFNNFIDLVGIKGVGLDIPSIRQILESAYQIMYDRYAHMENQKVNNIYKTKGTCPHFCFEDSDGVIKSNEFKDDGTVQFDEIFYSQVNGETVITSIDKLYNSVKNGEDVSIFFNGQKGKMYKLFLNRDDGCSGNGGEESYVINQKIYRENDTLDVFIGDSVKTMTAKEILKYLSEENNQKLYIE